MISGRFVVDAHFHAQRHTFKFQERGIDPNCATLAEGIATDPEVVIYDNPARLPYDMECYGDLGYKNYTGEANMGYYNPYQYICYIWIDDALKKSLGY